MKDHILVLGGDGYLGWPTAMRLSAMGYEVTVVDNYLRRDLCSDLDIDFFILSLHLQKGLTCG